MVLLEVTKNEVFIILLGNTFFEKTQRVVGARGVERSGQIDPQSCFRVRLPSNFGQNL